MNPAVLHEQSLQVARIVESLHEALRGDDSTHAEIARHYLFTAERLIRQAGAHISHMPVLTEADRLVASDPRA